MFALGYHYQDFDAALKDQIDKLIHTSNLYYNAPAVEAAEKLLDACGMDKVFFTNSGTEAIEGAIKAARKYAWNKDGHRTDHEIVAMEHSFHGPQRGRVVRNGKSSLSGGLQAADGGRAVREIQQSGKRKACVNDRTCAVILETVQGEGGIYPADPEFLRVSRLCARNGIFC